MKVALLHEAWPLSVAVIGAGTMGAGIAQVCAQAGWQPTSTMPSLKDLNVEWTESLRFGKRASPEARPHPNNGIPGQPI